MNLLTQQSPRSRSIALSWLTQHLHHSWTAGVHEGASPTKPKLEDLHDSGATTGYLRGVLVRNQY